MMNNRERVIQAIQHRETDRIPYQISFTKLEHERLAKYFNDNEFERKIDNCISMTGCDLNVTDMGGDLFLDSFGVVWDRRGADKDIGVIHEYQIDRPDVSLIHLPRVNHDRLRENYQSLCEEKNKGQFTMASISFSLFERAWTLCGMENLLVYMLTDEEFVDTLLDLICERNCEIIDEALKYDFDGFHFGDDWGQQRGLIMGAPLWRRFILPRIKKMYQKVKSAGKFVSQHSCGDIGEVFQDLIDAGLDIYQTFQPEIYDIKKVKKQFGNHITFWGGISTQQLLSKASPEEVKRVMIDTMRILGDNGGYILAPTHAVEHDVPPENVKMFLQIAENQQQYR